MGASSFPFWLPIGVGPPLAGRPPPHHRMYGSRIRRFGWSGQTNVPWRLLGRALVCVIAVAAISPYGRSLHETAHPTRRSHLPSPFGVGTVPAFDGPARCGVFPTDFSSTMPSADCPSALANLAARPLRVAESFVSPLTRAHASPSAGVTRRGVGQPVCLISGLLPAEPGALPGFSLLLSMRNCRVYVERRIGNRDFRLCCTLVPVPAASYPPSGRQFTPLLCTISPHLRLRPLPGHRYRLSPCPWLPFTVTWLGRDLPAHAVSPAGSRALSGTRRRA